MDVDGIKWRETVAELQEQINSMRKRIEGLEFALRSTDAVVTAMGRRENAANQSNGVEDEYI